MGQAENAPAGTLVGTVAGTDSAIDTLRYSLADNAGGRFAINSETGAVTVANGSLLDFESNATHQITVAVSDGLATYQEAFTVTIGNVDENTAPVVQVPQGVITTDEGETLTITGRDSRLSLGVVG